MDRLDRAATLLDRADGLLIAAGAGMGVDSGLPDFRGPGGFWKAHPPYAKAGLTFRDLANPRWFRDDPRLAWGFYGHRLNLYRETVPHRGFDLLRAWALAMPRGGFVFTSNVDGQFQKAGFHEECIAEVHGTIHRMQCLVSCGVGLFEPPTVPIQVDPNTMRAMGAFPACPRCGGLARPNILMFGDDAWDSARSDAQHGRLRRWLTSMRGSNLVIVELGAGGAVPTVRFFSESTAERMAAALIRINPAEPEVPRGHITLPSGALEALEAIEARRRGTPPPP